LGSDSEIYTYDANNRLTKITGNKSSSFNYDANGNQTKETINGQTTTYNYNGFNQLKTVELPDASVQTIGYDTFGIHTYTEYQNKNNQYMTSSGQVVAFID